MPTVIETSDEMVDRKVSGESLSFAEKILRKHGWKSGIYSVFLNLSMIQNNQNATLCIP